MYKRQADHQLQLRRRADAARPESAANGARHGGAVRRGGVRIHREENFGKGNINGVFTLGHATKEELEIIENKKKSLSVLIEEGKKLSLIHIFIMAGRQRLTVYSLSIAVLMQDFRKKPQQLSSYFICLLSL